MSFESFTKKKEVDAAFDAQKFDKEYMKDIVTKQYLLEQENKKRLLDSRVTQYFLDEELRRKTAESRASELNLNKFSQLLHQQQSSHFMQQYSDEQLKELIDSYFNNKNRKKSKR